MKTISNVKGAFWLLLAALIYGLYGIFTRYAGTEFGPVYITFVRNIIVFIILSIFTRSLWKKFKLEDLRWMLLMSIPGTLGMVATIEAFNHLFLGTTYISIYVGATVGSFIIGSIFFDEKISLIKFISLGLCLIGLFLIFNFSFDKSLAIYLIYAVFSGFCTAIWNVFSKKVTLKYSVTQVLTIDALLTILLSPILMYILNEKYIIPELSTPWLALFLFGIFGIFASLSLLKGFRYIQAQIGSLILLIEPAFGALFGFLFFREMLNFGTLLGGSLILSGSALSTWFEGRRNI